MRKSHLWEWFYFAASPNYSSISSLDEGKTIDESIIEADELFHGAPHHSDIHGEHLIILEGDIALPDDTGHDSNE